MDFNKLIARVKAILTTPKTEWPVIAAEPATIADLYKNYVVILAALTPVATFIGAALFGTRIPLVGTIHIGMGALLTQLVLTYALGLAMTYIVALIIDALAPSFGGQKNPVQAFKSAAYCYTPVWVVGILNIIPGLGILTGLLGKVTGQLAADHSEQPRRPRRVAAGLLERGGQRRLFEGANLVP